ncbi:hypothetical protein HYU17_02845 [Candidatus Woesearchaeota archaeon]|nr:hypothetical protein [Candidatus Woesearchaeota archaeon]
MKQLSEFVEEGKVKRGSPDPAEARSLAEQAAARLDDVAALPLTEKSARFRFEDAYEALREALQAFMAAEGYKPYSHEAIVAFAFERKLLPESKIWQLDRYREIRNDINYRGKGVGMEDAKEIIAFARDALTGLRHKFKGVM